MGGDVREKVWVVPVLQDEVVPSAVFSGRALRSVKTYGLVVALMSTDVSVEFVSELENNFELVLIKNFRKGRNKQNVTIREETAGNGDNNQLDFESVVSKIAVPFSKILIIQPGVIIRRHADCLFDTIPLKLVGDGDGRLVGVGISSAFKNKLGHRSVDSSISKESVQGNFWNFKRVKKLENIKWSDETLEELPDIFLATEITGLWDPKNMSIVPGKWAREKDWIAVIGMACRLPGANSLEEYWDLLENGQSMSGPLPQDRLPFCHITKSAVGNFLKCPVDEFDASFFGMSPAEATFTDIQARLLLEVSWEAFENASINPDKLRGTPVSVFHGSWLQEYKEIMNQDTDSRCSDEFMRKYLGNSFGCTAAKLSFFYGFTGENLATESGCSSSMVAVNLACERLRRRQETPLAVVTGANVILQMDEKQRILWAKDGNCKSFDSSANGYGRAEGIVILILKRYGEAVEDKNKIHGIILGGATTQEGLSKNFGAPTVDSEARCMKLALDNSGVAPTDVDYLEAHATGTAVGDPIEAEAICRVYADPMANTPRSPLWIGSGKTNIGHTESVSGLAGVVKTLLAMKYQSIPPHLHLTQMNPQINFDSIPGKVPVKIIPWPSNPGRPRIAGVSSFGITGTDVHIIIQEPPSPPEHLTVPSENTEGTIKPCPVEILTFSAKTTAAMEQLKASYLSIITPENLHDVCYSANTGRSHNLGYRQAILFSPPTGNAIIREYQSAGITTAGKPKICFTFPGVVGSMDFAPASSLYNSCQRFRYYMNCCEDTWSSKITAESSLLNTLVQKWGVDEPKPWRWYATAVAIQYSLTQLWIYWGIQPDVVLGQCMGELTAAVVAGSLTLEDAFKILKISEYFEADNEIYPGAMMALNCSVETCHQFIADMEQRQKLQQFQNHWSSAEDTRIDVALVNSPSQTVVAASPATLQKLKEICSSGGIKCHVLQAKYAVHSRFVERACKKAEVEIFQNIKHGPCKIPYVSSVTGALIKNEDLGSKYWYHMFRDTVQFSKACSVVNREECEVYLEIGLGAALTALTVENLGAVEDIRIKCLSSFQKNSKDDNGGCWIGLLNSLAQIYSLGIEVNWEKFYKWATPPRQMVDLPHYPFQRKSFWFKRNKLIDNKSMWENVAKEEKESNPLLGAEILNCSENSIYQSRISIENVPYIYEHLIGNQVIFPAAGYVEMFIAAVSMLSADKSRKITLIHFKIHRPLLLDKTKKSLLQTIVRREKNDMGTESWNLQVFAQGPERYQWILHASAQAARFQNNEFVEKQGKISLECEKSEDQFSQHFYQNMDKVGFNFGPNFRSLSKICRDGSKTVIQAKLLQDSSKYLLHPILIDAMVQGFMVHTKPSPKKLLVPTQIESFTLNQFKANSISMDTTVYVSCETILNSSTVTLLTEDGTVIATLYGIEFVGTNIASLLKAAGATKMKNSVEQIYIPPTTYDIIWQVSKIIPGKAAPSSTVMKWVMFHDIIDLHPDNISPIDAFSKKMTQLNRHVTFISTFEENQTFEGILDQISFDMEGILYCVFNSQPELYPNSRGILEPLLSLSKRILSCKKFKSLPKFYVVTNRCWTPTEDNIDQSNGGSCLSGLVWGFMRSFRMECPRVISKTIDLDTRYGVEDWTNQLIHELWIKDTEPEVCLRNDERFCRRMKHNLDVASSLVPTPITVENPEYIINLPESKLLSDVTFTNRQVTNELGDGQVKIEVRYCALNFKDILSIISPGSTFDTMKLLGLDYSGIITKIGCGVTDQWKVGDAVFGCNFQERVVASHTRIGQEWLVKIPKTLTLSEAATLPTVFLTAWYCMVNVAKLTDGQTVLIHAATGGVGLIAIQIAKMLGVNIIATAGSPRKRAYLKSIGIDKVFNSRHVNFRDQIRQFYCSRGIAQPIDMVLNCLTGPGFKEASLDLVRDGGHFVEISKLDIWTDEDVKNRRPLVNYTVVNAMELDSMIYQDIMQILSGFLQNHPNHLQPLPNSIFPACDIVAGLRFLQKASHIGKVLLELPCPIPNGSDNPPENFLPVKQCLFNDRSTYFISGGKGTIGLAIVKWMIAHGAKYLVLGGRSSANETVKETVDDLQKTTGSIIICTQIDVSVYSQCKLLFQSIAKDPKLPPLRGIHHCAGILSDKLIGNQDWSNFDTVLRPKVDGAWNLHTTSLELQLSLDFFILHSSLCSTFGNVGQANYVAANAYMDSLAEKRRGMDLPGLSINWGKWVTGIAEHLETPLLPPFSVEQGLHSLETVMIAHRNTSAKGLVAAGNFNAENLLQMAPWYEQTLLEHVISLSRSSSEPQTVPLEVASIKPISLKQCYWEQVSLEEKEKTVRQHVLWILCETLGLNENEVQDGVSFADMGIDSLMSIEFANKLLQLVEVDEARLGRLDMEENDTMEKISNLLVAILENNTVNP